MIKSQRRPGPGPLPRRAAKAKPARRKAFFALAASIAVLLVSSGGTARAQYIWTGGASDNNWTNSSNWTNGTSFPQSSGDTATFDNTASNFTPTITGGSSSPSTITVDTLTINSASYTITVTGANGDAASLTFDTTGVVNNSGTEQAFVAGSSDGSASGSFIFTGTASGGTQTTWTINSGGIFDISQEPAGSTVSVGSISAPAGGGTISLGANTLNTGGDNTSTSILGTIIDSGSGGSIIKSGTGTLTIDDSANSTKNSYSGGTILTNGTLVINSNVTLGGATAIGTGPLTITSSGGPTTLESLSTAGTPSSGVGSTNPTPVSLVLNNTLNIQGNFSITNPNGDIFFAGPINLSPSAGTANTITGVTPEGQIHFTGVISGSSTQVGISLVGAPTDYTAFIYDGTAANTYTGLTTVGNNAFLVLQQSTVLSGAVVGNILVNPGGSVDFLGFSNQIATTSTVTVNSTGINDGGTVFQGFELRDYNQTIANLFGNGTVGLGSGTLTVGAGSFTGDILDGNFGTGGNLVVAGPGTLNLSGTNTYTGTTTVSGGTLQAGSSTGFSSSSAFTITAPGVLDVNGFAPTIGSLAGDGSVTNNGSALGTLITGNDGTSTAFTGVISDGTSALALTKIGAGTLTLSAANTYSGATTVSDGTLQAGSSTGFSGSSAFTITSPGILDINGFAPTIGSLAGTGSVLNNGATTATLTTGNDNTSTTFSGVISDGTSSLALTKIGTGALTLSGANTYSGATTINGGSLLVNGSLAAGSAVTVNSGGALGGTGTVSGAVTIANGGALTPGSGSSPGTLTVGSLTLNTSSSLNYYLGAPGTVGGGVNSLTIVNGNLTLAGSLYITRQAGFGVGTYELLSYTGALTNNTLAIGSTPAVGYNYQVVTSTANEVNLDVTSNGQTVFWNGSVTTANGTINGGTGTWDNVTTNWTDATGTVTGSYNGVNGVFQGTAGTVTLGDNITFTNLEFYTTGYVINPDAANTFSLMPATGATITTGAGVAVTINAPLTGTGGISTSGSGSITLGGANTYSGATTVGDGTLLAGSSAGLSPNSAFTITSPGILDVNGFAPTIGSLAGTGSVTNNGAAAGTLTTGNDNTSTTFSGVISNGTSSLALTKIGTGTLTLSGANTYSGATAVNDGTLQAGSSTGFSASSAFTITSPGILDINGFTPTIGSLAGTGSVTNNGAATGTLTTGNDNTSTTFSGVISNGASSLALTKIGTGVLTLSGANTYSGATTVTDGTLLAGSSAGLSPNSAFTITSPGVLNINAFAPTIGSLAGTGSVTNNGAAAGNLTTGNDNTSTTFSGVISNGASTLALTKIGTGTLTLSGANTYSGATAVNDGTLQAGSSAGFSASSAFTVTSPGILDINGFAPSIGSLAGTGSVTNNGATTGTLTNGSNNTSTTFSGVISNGTSSLALTKIGTGALTLSGANTYSGATTVNAGSLLVNGSLAAGSAVTINSSATLGGTGTISGAVTIANGGALTPGSGSAPGTITVGALTLNSSSSLNYDLGTPGTVGGGVNSLTAVNGNLVLAGTLNITQETGFGIGTYELLSYTGALTNNTLTVGSTPAAGVTYTISTSTANQVDLDVTSNLQPLFWNGSVTTADGTINGGTGTWNTTTTNWTDASGTVTGTYNGVTGIFEGTAGTVTLGSNITFSSLQFNTTGYVVAPDAGSLYSLMPTTGATITTGSGVAVTINAPITGSGGIATSGSGSITLGGANTYSGTTTVSSGTLLAGSSTGFSPNSAFTINAPGILDVNGFAPTTGSLAGSGSVTNNGATTGTLITGNNNTSTTFSGIISDGTSSIGLTKIGTGALTLSGGNTYTGATTVNGGSLLVNGSLAAGSAVTVNTGATLGGTGTISGAVTFTTGGALTPGSGASPGTLTVGALTLNSSSTLNYLLGTPGTVGGGVNSLTVVNGNLILSGTLYITQQSGFGLGTYELLSYTGTLTNDPLVVGSTPATGYAYTINTSTPNQVDLDVASNGQTVFWNGVVTTANGVVNGGTGTWDNVTTNWTDASGTVTGSYNGVTGVFEGSAGTVTLGDNITFSTLEFLTSGYVVSPDAGNLYSLIPTAGATITTGSGVAVTINAPITGTGGISFEGSGAVYLGGTNTYSGATLVSGGTLHAGSSAGFSPNSAFTITSPGVLDIAGFSPTIGSLAGSGTVTNDGAAAGTLTTGNDNTSTTFSGVISSGASALALTKIGTGTFTLSGANTYTGATTVNDGTLQAGSSNGFSSNSDYTVTSPGILDVNGFAPTIGSLAGSGSVTNNGAVAGTLTIGNDNTSTTFSGVLSDGTSSLALTKVGGGVFTLTGTNNYSGATTINAGTLLVNGSLAAGSAVAVNNGGTLGGTGTVSGAVTVASGGTFTPGSGSSPGTITVGSLTLNSGSNLDYELGAPGTVGGGVNSFTIDNGNLTLGGTLNVTQAPGTIPSLGTYELISYAGTLTNNTLAVGSSAPIGYTYTVDTSTPNEVNLDVTSNGQTVFWNGSVTTANGMINGGTGTWDNVTTNWTDASGTVTGAYNGADGVFEGTAGTVTLGDNIAFTTLEFYTTGYVINPDAANTFSLMPATGATITTAAGVAVTINAPLTGSGGITLMGPGLVTLAGTNTYTGATMVNDGTLQAGSSAGLSPSSAFTITSPGILDINGFAPTIGSLAGNGSVTNNGATLGTLTTGNNNTSTTFSGVISDGTSPLALTKTGFGTFTVSGTSTYSGATTVNDGTLQAGSSTGFSPNSAYTITSPGVLDINGFTPTIGSLAGTGSVINNGSAPGTLITGNDNTSTTFSGVISDGISQLTLTKIGSGTLTLTGTNTYSGGTNLTNGGLFLDDTPSGSPSNAIGSGPLTITNAGGAASPTVLGSDIASQMMSNTVNVLGNFSVSNPNGDFYFTGNLNLANQTHTITGLTALGQIHFQGGISSPTSSAGGISFVGGTSQYTAFIYDGSTPNTYTGLTTVGNNAFLVLGQSISNSALVGNVLITQGGSLDLIQGGATNQTAANITVTDNSTGLATTTALFAGFELQDNSDVIGTLLGTGSVGLGSGTLTVSSGLFSGTIADGNSGFTGGNLVKTGAGTLTLSGTSTYTGTTTVSAGTLQAGSSTGFSPNSAFTVASGGILDVNGFNPTVGSLAGAGVVTNNSTTLGSLITGFSSTNTSFTGTLQDGAGPLGLVKTGFGIQTIFNSTYSGPTTALEGILQAGSTTAFSPRSAFTVGANGAVDLNGFNNSIGSLAGTGTVANDGSSPATLTTGLDNTNTTFSGTIQDGISTTALVKTGTGAMTLASSNTFSGGTTLQNGSLVIESVLALGSGNVKVTGGALKAGGNPIDIQVGGNYTQTSGGELDLRIGGTSQGTFDRLAVVGSAALAGRLNLTSLNGFVPTRGTSILIVDTGGGVTGQFQQLTGNLTDISHLNLTVQYEPDDVILNFTGTSFSSLPGLTPNERAVAEALDNVVLNDKSNKVLDYLDALPSAASLRAAFDRIAPEEYAVIYQISTSSAKVQATSVEGRLDAIHGGPVPAGAGGPVGPTDPNSPAPPPAAPDALFGVYANTSGEFVSVNDSNNAAGYNFDSGGFTVGADYRFDDGFVAGVLLNYTRTRADLVDNGRLDADGIRAGIYGSLFGSGLYLNGFLGAGYNDYGMNRQGLDAKVTGNTNGGEFNGFLQTGYDGHVGGVTVGPVGALNYTYTGLSSFQEQGSLDPLSVDSYREQSVRTNIGVRATYQWHLGKYIIAPEIRATWQHEFADVVDAVTASMLFGSPRFTVNSTPLGRDSILLNVGFTLTITPQIVAYLYYDGELARTNYQANNFMMGFRFDF